MEIGNIENSPIEQTDSQLETRSEISENTENIIINIPNGYVSVFHHKSIKTPSFKVRTSIQEHFSDETQDDLHENMIHTSEKNLLIEDSNDSIKHWIELSLPYSTKAYRCIVTLENGTISSTRTNGRLELKNKNGYVVVKNHHGDIVINKGKGKEGNVETFETSGNLKIISENGDIIVNNHHGDIVINKGKGKKGNVKTFETSGNLKIISEHGDIIVNNHKGNQEIRQLQDKDGFVITSNTGRSLQIDNYEGTTIVTNHKGDLEIERGKTIEIESFVGTLKISTFKNLEMFRPHFFKENSIEAEWGRNATVRIVGIKNDNCLFVTSNTEDTTVNKTRYIKKIQRPWTKTRSYLKGKRNKNTTLVKIGADILDLELA